MRLRCHAFFLAFAGLAAGTFGPGLEAVEGEPGPPVPHVPRVAGIDRALGDRPPQQILRGLVLIGELGCVSCHRPTEIAASHLQTRQAPLLETVGKRIRVDHLREWLSHPHQTKPGTTMPDVFHGEDPAARGEKVESLVHYLASSGSPAEGNAIARAVRRGEVLYHTVGCSVCHDSRQDGAIPLENSIPLGVPADKYTIPSLAQFLQDPLAVRPSARMPHLNLRAEEAHDIASYLLKGVRAEPNLNFEYFEGNWDKLPDFPTLKPQATGTVSGFDVNVGRPDGFAMRFSGYLHIAAEGQYRFHLGSDDGSRLRINGQEIVSMDGIHSMMFGIGRAFLSVGAHPIVVEYFEGGGEQELRVEYEGTNLPRQSIESALTVTKDRPASNRATFVIDPELSQRGKQEFERSGCRACHQPESPPASTIEFSRLRPQRGCLAERPAQPAPWYGLSSPQRSAINAALTFLKQPNLPDPNPVERIRRTVVAFNCVACHQRGELGGVEPTRNAVFTSNQPEMGDEGRIPPTLNGVGAKLRDDWLRQILDRGGTDRPYMLVRMPKFGLANIGHLVASFVETDPLPDDRRPSANISENKLKAAGRQLVGAQGFSCIKCHTWGNIPATGVQSISLTSMHRRLRESWLHDYLLEPQTYRSGTRMPASWPNGQVLLPQVLDGQAATQIHAVARFLSDGDQAAIPTGLGRDPIELIATTEPVIYRNFIQGAGTRAIGVGYPEQVNLAFDANDLRLAMIWQGAFIDAAKHWTDRGAGFQGPLGDNILSRPAGPDLARLDDRSAPWPHDSPRSLGYQFRGYRFDERRRPIFLYSHGDIRFRDTFEPRVDGNQVVLRRTMTRTGDDAGGWHYRAALAEKIVALPDGWYQIGDQWKTRIQFPAGASHPPFVRGSENRFELLVPLPGGESPLQQEIVW